MWDAAVELAAAVERALTALGEALAGVAPAWLVLGVALHLANQVLRGRGWLAIVRAALPAGTRAPGAADTVAAWVAGAGAGGVASARGGDAVRVLLLSRSVPRAGCPLLAGTLVAEGAGELAAGAALLAIALAAGVGPELNAPAAGGPALALAAALLLVGLAALRLPRLRRLFARAAHGCAPLRAPGAYARTVLPWQLASRACRLLALGCFLAAFGLPVSPAAVLLVAFAQGSARLVPFAPASVGAGVAMLAATFASVTGSSVPAGDLAAFFVGTSTVLTLAGAALALTICWRTLRPAALVATLRAARRRPVPAA
jgi:Lysylphosphatidylglycerol synthase TM region